MHYVGVLEPAEEHLSARKCPDWSKIALVQADKLALVIWTVPEMQNEIRVQKRPVVLPEVVVEVSPNGNDALCGIDPKSEMH